MGYIGLKILNILYNVPIKKLLQFDLWRIEKKNQGHNLPIMCPVDTPYTVQWKQNRQFQTDSSKANKS